LRSPTRGRADEIDIEGLLTGRQQDVLFALVEAGASNRDIARSLAKTEATIKVHMRAILSALHVASRAEALQLVYRRASGWLARRRSRQDLPTADRTHRENDDPERG
jgi:DNA-binding NarL/FixJ family response regulator